ncbi:MAG: HEPN domain-containing protein [Nanoarchaeota archaeon]|nr:HEPN domain-containing protein [Nanoarchaeota archaeon]MBU1632614.1 HEPN domain-containing protein [Nanoarchaeota archaeon]MBU1876451.1 HEPN domain-containing protein [Nanoarchaeota archaeon]
MNYERLSVDKIEKKEFNLSLAERDLKAAKDSLNSQDYDWALSIAYNAVLQAGRALMFSLGYRPKGNDKHKTVFAFLEESGFDQNIVFYFDNIRKIRHIAVYDEAGIISKETAEETIKKAEIFVQKIRTIVLKIRTEK